ncbi:MAG: hypothetical protein HQ556_00855 [Candidatus Marinimicrobia bacterium]|nr:hypothetical protein [Candidatus Neomarinimicrobiota bacterium]
MAQIKSTFIYVAVLSLFFSVIFTQCENKKDRPAEAGNLEKLDPPAKHAQNPDGRDDRGGIPNRAVAEIRPLRISMLGSDFKDGTIRFQYSLPMILDTELESAEFPKIEFSPEIPGDFKWESATELSFQPEPGSTRYAQTIRVTCYDAVPLAGEDYKYRGTWRGRFTIPHFEIAGKIASWPILDGQPRFINFLNWRTRQIGAGPLLILYDQIIDTSAVRPYLKVLNQSGAELPIALFNPENINQVYHKEVNTNFIVALQLLEIPDDGDTLTLHIPSWKRTDSLSIVERTLFVNKTFSMDKAFTSHRSRPDNVVPLNVKWSFHFNRSFEIEYLKSKLSISPDPKSINVSGFTDRNWRTRETSSGARVKLDLEPGTEYHFTLDSSFTDVLGNRLEIPFDTIFTSKDLAPILELPKEALVVEPQNSRLPMRLRNVSDLKARIYKFETAQDYGKALLTNRKQSISANGLGKPVREIQVKVEDYEPNKLRRVFLPLGNEPGLMLVEIEAQSTGSEAVGSLNKTVLIQSTDLAISSKLSDDAVYAWVTRLQNAEIVEDATVELRDRNNGISTGVTDENGTTSLEVKGKIKANDLINPLVIIVKKDGMEAVLVLKNNQLSNAWQFGLKGIVKGHSLLFASIFTDRGVYRPGEMVHLKIISSDDNRKSHEQVVVRIEDPRGQQLIRKTLNLDEYNTTALDIQLKDQAAVGDYFIQVSMGEKTKRGSFQVEEYRVPTFQVSVSSIKKTWNLRERVEAKISAEYLHGGLLKERQVRWNVRRFAVPFEPHNFPKYIFNIGDSEKYAGSLMGSEGVLDENGSISVQFKPDHPSTIGPMRYTVEGSVTDVDRQVYAGRMSRVIHPAEFYVGVKPPTRKIMPAGSVLEVPVVAINPDQTIREGAKCTVSLERIDHHTAARMSGQRNVQMLNREEKVKIQTCEITTLATAVSCKFTIPIAGYYRIRVSAQDEDHRRVQTGFEITVSGDNPTAWPRFDQDIIKVVADKPEYKIGDVANLVIQSPYKEAKGLLTIERDGVISSRTFDIMNNTPKLEIPILSAHAPNIFVSVIIMRGRTHDQKDASGFETGAPAFKIGYANLKVDPAANKLSIQINPSTSIAHPGQKIKVDLKVKDYADNPSAGQVTLMVVDEAVLGLTDYETPQPILDVLAERPLAVRTGTSLFDLPHSKRSRLEKLFPGGDQDMGDFASRFPEILRNLFMSTAYWNPNVIIGPDGQGSVEFDVPDNLTTFRIMAIVTDGSNRVGSADEQLQVRKPLMIQPVITRFVYPEDRLEIEALVFNGSNQSGPVTLSGVFEGLELTGKASKSTRTIKAGDSETFKFPVLVTAREEAIIRFDASLSEYSDAVEVKIPVLPPGTRRTMVQSKMVSESVLISAAIPADRIPNTTQFEVVVSTTALSELKGAVQYLMRYPNGCIEQTTSTAYPLVVLKELLPEMGVEVDLAELKKYSDAGIKRILSFQTTGGGLSYWPGGNEPHAFATAFGLTALIEAKKKGYDISDDALDGMADYLESVLRQGEISENMPHGGMADGDTRALLVMTLGRLGRPQAGYVSALWNKKESLTPFGLSFLAIAVKEMPGDKSLLEPILAVIRQTAEESEKEYWYDGKPKGGWSLDSPLRTHASALLAFATTGNSDGATGKYMNGLLKRQKNGLWGNTQENVFGIMGVHAAATRKSGGDGPRMNLAVNGKTYDESELEKSSDRVLRLSLDESSLNLAGKGEAIQEVSLENNAAGPLYLTVRAQYEVPMTEENRRALSRGFEISRIYETMDGTSLEGKSIPLGSLVRVRIKVKSSSSHNYVAIADKLPAGLEPLNTKLKTTEKVDQGKFSAVVQRSLASLSYSEIRDSRVAFYVDEMLPNEYEFHFIARATTPGTFLRPESRIEAMYQPDIFGTTAIDYVTVEN